MGNHERINEAGFDAGSDAENQQAVPKRDLELEIRAWRYGVPVVISHEVRMQTSEEYRDRFVAAEAGAAALLQARAATESSQ